jgi:hypothetical protein
VTDGRAQLVAHDEGAGAALDEQDRLAVAEHAGQAARDAGVEVTAGDDNDDVGVVLFDLPNVVSAAEPLRVPGLAGGCEIVEGDFFE